MSTLAKVTELAVAELALCLEAGLQKFYASCRMRHWAGVPQAQDEVLPWKQGLQSLVLLGLESSVRPSPAPQRERLQW